MQKITFEDLPSTNTPLNASNLNTLQDNVEGAIDNLISNTYGTSQTKGYSQEYINGLSILGLKYNKTLTTDVSHTRIKITATKNYQCFFMYGQGGCLCSITNMYGQPPQIQGFANLTTATGDKINQTQLYINVGNSKELFVYSNDDFTIEQY